MSNTTAQHKHTQSNQPSALDLYEMPFEYNVTIAEERRAIQDRTHQ